MLIEHAFFIQTSGAQHKLVPPGLYHDLITKHSIQTFKQYLIAGLSSFCPNFLLNLWCLFIRQVVLTFNLLHPNRLNPCLLAVAFLNWSFYFNITSLALPGTKVLIFERPCDQSTFAHHVVEGWYLGPDLENHQWYKVYVPLNHYDQVPKTIESPPHNCPVPALSSTDAARCAIQDLAKALKLPPCCRYFILGTRKSGILELCKKPCQALYHPPPLKTHHNPFY